jgi:hypothetical protein
MAKGNLLTSGWQKYPTRNTESYSAIDAKILSDLEHKSPFKIYPFPCGSLRISNHVEDNYLNRLPTELVDTLEDINDLELYDDIDWLLDMRDKYPTFVFFYYYIARYYKAERDTINLNLNAAVFRKNCPNTPLALGEQAMAIIYDDKGDEAAFKTIYINGTNLHDYFPNRKYFYVEEVIPSLSLFFGQALSAKDFDTAQEFINVMGTVVGPNHLIVQTWITTLKSAMIPRWVTWATAGVLIGIVGLVLWGLYKLGAWIVGLF